MALSANTVWEVRPGVGNGLSTNGGGFVTGASGTDRSQQAAAHATVTVVSGTLLKLATVIGYTVTAADVGNIYNNVGVGSSISGLYQIIAVDVPNNNWQFDRSIGTMALQTGSGSMGGAFNSIASLHNVTVAGNTVHIKNSGTDTPGQSVTFPVGTAQAPVTISGYNAARGDTTTGGTYSGTHNSNGFLNTAVLPLINVAGNLLTINAFTQIQGVRVTGSRTAALLSFGATSSMFRCEVTNTSTNVAALAVTNCQNYIDCDLSCATATGGYVLSSATGTLITSSRITSTNGGGINAAASLQSLGNVFYSMAASQNAINLTGASPVLLCIGNTFYSVLGTCVALGNQVLTSPFILLTNNQVSGCGTFANNLRSDTQVIALHSFHNRIRNTTTSYTGWLSNTSINDVTTADTDANEYVDTTTNNFRLKPAALGVGAGLPNTNSIGAFQLTTGSGGTAGIMRHPGMCGGLAA